MIRKLILLVINDSLIVLVIAKKQELNKRKMIILLCSLFGNKDYIFNIQVVAMSYTSEKSFIAEMYSSFPQKLRPDQIGSSEKYSLFQEREPTDSVAALFSARVFFQTLILCFGELIVGVFGNQFTLESDLIVRTILSILFFTFVWKSNEIN